MQSNLTGNLLGGTILADLLQHVEDAVDAVSANVQVCATYQDAALSGGWLTSKGKSWTSGTQLSLLSMPCFTDSLSPAYTPPHTVRAGQVPLPHT